MKKVTWYVFTDKLHILKNQYDGKAICGMTRSFFYFKSDSDIFPKCTECQKIANEVRDE